MVARLNNDLSVKVAELNKVEAIRNAAQAEADKCNNQLSLAKRLVNALASEKIRWAQNIDNLKAQMEVVVGDVLMSAAFISYAGPFTKIYREWMMEQKFIDYFRKFNIPMTADLNPVNMLVDEATKAEWNNEGLPTDVVSIENGTILVNSARYPLMIDPQL